MASNRIKGITLEILGDTSSLTKALKDATDNISSLKKQLSDVDRALKFNPGNMELLAQKSELTAKRIEETKKALDTLREADAQIKAQLDKGVIGKEKYDAFRREIIYTERDLKTLQAAAADTAIRLENSGKSADEMAKELRDAEKAAEIFREELDKAAQGAISFGDILKANIAGNLITDGLRRLSQETIDFARNSVEAGIEFESAFAGVAKTVDGTSEQLNEIRQDIRDMALEIPATTTEIAAVAEAAGQLGIQTENVITFARTMIDLGESTNVAADEAASSLARIANITGMAQTDFDRLGSSVVELGNNYATTESEIIALGQRLAGSATEVNMSEADIMGFAAALSSVGIGAEMGGSAFSKAITEIDKAAAYGADAVAQFANIAKMSADDFIALWSADSAAAMAKFIDGLGSAKEEGGNLNILLDEIGFKEIRLSDVMKRAGAASDLFANAITDSNRAWEENIALQSEAEKRYATTESQIKMAQNAINDAGISLSESLLPVLADVARKISETVADNREEIQQFGKGIAGAFEFILENGDFIVATIGSIGTAFATMKAASTIDGIVAAYRKWKTAAEAAAVAQTQLNAAQMLSPAATIALGITVLTAAISIGTAALNHFKEAEEEVQAEARAVIDALSELNDAIDDNNAKYKRQATELENNAVVADNLISVLDELSAKENLSAEQKDEMASAVAQLNSIYPELNLQLSEEGRLLSENLATAKDYIAQRQREIELAAITERQIELAKERVQLEQDIAKGEEERAEIQEVLNKAAERQGVYNSYLGVTVNKLTFEEQAQAKVLTELNDKLNESNQRLQEVTDTEKELASRYTETTKAATEQKDAVTALIQTSERSRTENEAFISSIKKSDQALLNLESAYQKVQESGKLTQKEIKDLSKAYPELSKYIDENGEASIYNSDILKILSEQNREERQKNINAAIAEQEATIATMKAQAAQSATSYGEIVKNIFAAAEARKTIADEFSKGPWGFKDQFGNAQTNPNSNINAINKEIAESEQALLKLKELSESISGGLAGGYSAGRGSGKSAADLAKEEADKLEKIRKEALDADLAAYNHRVKMGELSAEQQIAELGKIREAHSKENKLTLEEERQFETEIYDLKKALSDQEKKEQEELEKERLTNINEYGDAITEALKRQKREEIDLKKETIQEQIDLISDVKYREIEAGKEVTTEKLKLIDEEYIAKVKTIDASLAAALEAGNKEIQKRIDIIALTDKETAAKLQAAQDEIDSINEIADAERKQSEERANEQKRQRLEKELAESEDIEDQERLLQELQEFEVSLAAKGREEERKARIEELEKRKKELLEEAQTAAEVAAKEAEAILKAQETAAKNATEELKNGKFSPEDEKQSIKSLEEVYKRFEETAMKSAAELVNSGKEGQEKALKILEAYYPNWKDKGTKFTDRLVQGLTDGEGNVIDKASELGQKALDAFEAAFSGESTGGTVSTYSGTLESQQQSAPQARSARIATDTGSPISTLAAAMTTEAQTLSAVNISPVMAQARQFTASVESGVLSTLSDNIGLINTVAQKMGLAGAPDTAPTQVIENAPTINFTTTINNVKDTEIPYLVDREQRRALRKLTTLLKQT